MNNYILIDYDNLSRFQKSKGLLYNIELVISQLTSTQVAYKNITVRLYGGWYENDKATKLAQALTAEIRSVFPTTSVLRDGKQVIINVELANSLIVVPGKLLFNTYRKRGISSGLGCEHPINVGCKETSCPILGVHDFFNSGKCSSCNHVTPDILLYRSEQKLVDSMITADIVHLSKDKQSICLVSSDDDFWPAILTAVTLGSMVIQFHTDDKTVNPLYLNNVKYNYSQKSLE